MSTALPATEDRTALLARLWTKATGHAAERPIHCAACNTLHERDCLLWISSPTRNLIAALCDRCAELASRDLATVEARIDCFGRNGRFCVHLIDGLDGYRFSVVDADCNCGLGAVS